MLIKCKVEFNFNSQELHRILFRCIVVLFTETNKKLMQKGLLIRSILFLKCQLNQIFNCIKTAKKLGFHLKSIRVTIEKSVKEETNKKCRFVKFYILYENHNHIY